jgi:hypothetical protein
MAAKAGVSYRYHVAFPRVFDAVRPDWPITLIDRLLTVPGVVDVLFPDLTAAWRTEATPPRRESRRRVIELVTNNAKDAAADTTRDRIYAVLRDLIADVGADHLVVCRWRVELEVLAP